LGAWRATPITTWAERRGQRSKQIVHRFDVFVDDYLRALLQERLYLRGILGH
jgi:hypothetical protein